MKTLSRYGVGYLADTPQGLFVVDPRDFWITRTLLKRGEYDRDTIQFLSKLIAPDSLICFVGAHIGTLLVPLAAKAGRVVAYEANPSNFRYLGYNVRLNNLGNVTLHNLAAGDRDGIEVSIHHETSNTGHSSINFGENGTVRVPMVSLDKHLDAAARVRLIVMDIEGAEVHALRGMRNTLGRVDFLYTEFCPQHLAALGESAESFIDALTPHFAHMYFCGDTPQAFKDRSWVDFLRRAQPNDLLNLLFTNQELPT
jgi:FkbM family methyltransferase